MERRALLHLLTALGAGAAIPADALETLRSGLDRALGAGAENSVEDWEQAAAEHAYSIRVMAPTALVGVLAADIADIRQALDHRTDLDRPSLERVSAQLAAIMAMALDEVGDPLASRWWSTARRAADRSGDRDLKVYVNGRQALVTSRSPGNLQRADEAVRLAKGHPSAGLAEAHAARAVILARSGDRTGAQQALRDLDELYERLPAEVTGEHAAVWGWPQHRYTGERTKTRLSLGDPSLYDELPPPRSHNGGPRGQAIGELHTAWARINAGSVNEGLDDAANAVIGLPAEHQTRSMKALVGRVYASLPDRKARELPAARELRALTAAT